MLYCVILCWIVLYYFKTRPAGTGHVKTWLEYTWF